MKEFEYASPAELGIDSRGIQTFLEKTEEQGIDMHALLVLRHGKIAAEGYRAPYARDKTYTLYSASKTFTAMAVGFAVQDGLLREDDLVWRFFPEKLDGLPCENMQKIRVRHLLTMTVGFDEDPHDFPFHGRTDWIRNFLTAYVPHEPGTKFVYSTHASYMLSAIVTKVTGKTVHAYLREKLFGPLGIEGEWWEESPQHVSVGGWGLMVTARDYAKLGQFLLQRGCWNGKQLLDAAWIDRAASAVVSNADNPTEQTADRPDFTAGYGYQIWRLRAEDAYMASGGFGQYTMVFPKKDLVVTMFNGTHCDHLFESLWTYLYPAVKEETEEGAGDSAAAAADAHLAEYLRDWTVPLSSGEAHSGETERRIGGWWYRFPENRYGYAAVCFDFPDGAFGAVSFRLQDGGCYTLDIGYGEWKDGHTSIRTEDTDTDWNVIYPDVSVCGAWAGKNMPGDVLEIRMVYDHTPFWDILRFHFDGRTVIMEAKRNVWHYGEHLDRILYGYCAEMPESKLPVGPETV